MVAEVHVVQGIDRLPPAIDLPEPVLGALIADWRVSALLHPVRNGPAVLGVFDPEGKVAARHERDVVDCDCLRPDDPYLAVFDGLLP